MKRLTISLVDITQIKNVKNSKRINSEIFSVLNVKLQVIIATVSKQKMF